MRRRQIYAMRSQPSSVPSVLPRSGAAGAGAAVVTDASPPIPHAERLPDDPAVALPQFAKRKPGRPKGSRNKHHGR